MACAAAVREVFGKNMFLLKKGMLGELRRLTERLASLHERSEQQLTPAEASEVLADIVTANREFEEKMDEQRAHEKELSRKAGMMGVAED